MKNFFTRMGFRFPVYLLIAVCVLFAEGVNAQCSYTGGEGTTSFTMSCSEQSTTGPGGGAYRYYTTNLTAGAWYQYLISPPSGITLSCAEPSYPANGAWGTSCLNTWSYMQSPTTVSTGNDFLIETAGSWNGNSATLYYQQCVPGAPSWSTEPTTVCKSTAATYTINAPSYATYYNWAVTGGTINSGQGTTSASITFTSTGTQTITVTPYNSGTGNTTSGCSGTALTGSINVQATSVAGTITQSPGNGGDVCTGSNVSYTLSGQTGSIAYWQYQWNTTGGSYTNWGSAANPYNWTSSLNGASILYVEAVVQNGVCSAVTTAPVNVTVQAASVAGTITQSPASGGDVCNGSNVGYSLSGQTGSIAYWQYQWNTTSGSYTNWGSAGTNPINWTSSLNGASILYVEAVVQDGVCPAVATAPVNVTVNAATVLGTYSNNGPINFCDPSGDYTTPITLSGNTGTISWQWGSSNGGVNAWTPGGHCCFPSKVNVSDGNADRTRAVVQNGVCAAVTGAWVLLQDKYNVAPASLTASSTSYCTNTVPGNITLTANYAANIDILGTTEFATTCGGAPIASVTAGNNVNSVSTIITSPSTSGTYTYYSRYNPGANTAGYTACAATGCVSTTVTVNSIPAITNVTAAANPICGGSTTVLTANGVSGTGATVNWYTATGGGGNSLGSGTTLTVGGDQTYYARVTGTCATPAEANLPVTLETTAPSIAAPAAITTNNSPNNSCGAAQVFAAPTGSDNCAGEWAGNFNLASTSGPLSAVASNLKFWVKGDAGVVKDGSGNVSEWRDISGNSSGNKFYQPTFSQRPALTAASTSFNGYPVVTFTTANYLPQVTSMDGGAASTYTMFVVDRLNGGSNARLCSSNTTNWLFGNWGGAAEKNYCNGWISSSSNSTPTVDALPHMYELTSNGVVASGTNFYDYGVIQNTGTAGSPNGPGALQLNGYQGGNELSSGDVAEVIYYNTILTTAQRQIVEGYLAYKYNLPCPLASMQAYQTFAGTTTYGFIATDKSANTAVTTQTATISTYPGPTITPSATTTCQSAVNVTTTGMAPAGYSLTTSVNSNAGITVTGGAPEGSTWTEMAWAQFPLPGNTTWNTLFRGNGQHHIIAERTQGATNAGVLLGTYNSGFYPCTGASAAGGSTIAGLSNLTQSIDLSTLSTGWHHIAAVGTGGTTTFYIDGVCVGHSATEVTGDNVVTVGNGPSDGQDFGTIDEAKVYNIALSQNAISNIMTQASTSTSDPNWNSLVLYYKMDGASPIPNSATGTSACTTCTGTIVSPGTVGSTPTGFYTYTYATTGTLGGTFSSNNTTNESVTLSNLTSSGSGTVTAYATANSCSSTTKASPTITVEPTLNYGTATDASGNTQTICNGATPAGSMKEAGATGSTSFTYQWYYQASVVSAPSGNSTSGWTSLGSTGNANTATFTPQAITGSTTYACFVTPGGSPTCGTGTWATGAIQITVLPTVGYGTATDASGNTQTICNGATPAGSMIAAGATGSTSFTYQWYYQANVVSAPSGNSTSGWTSLGSTGNANTATFTPQAITGSTTYACFVTPGGSPTCGTGTWATGAIQITVLPAVGYGTAADASGNTQTICNGATPAGSMIAAGAAGSTSFTYQWYYQASVVSAPNGNSTSGWTSLGSTGNANTATFTPQAITGSTTYACFVTPGGSPTCGTGTWATGAIQVTVLPTVGYGTAADASGNTQTICNGATPAGSMIAAGATGSTSFTYQWYYQASVVSAPSGNSTSGWTSLGSTGNANTATFTPQAITGSTTYACFVTPVGSPTCGTGTWATGAIQITVLPTVGYGTATDASGNTQTICNGATPAGNMTANGATGSTSFSYQWYYQAGIIANPSGGTSTSGWTACGATQGSNFATATFTPSGTLTTSTSYACFVTPGGSPTCGVGTWANGVIQITVAAAISYGTATDASGNTQAICYNTTPAGNMVAAGATGSAIFSYQWYYQAGIITNPSGGTSTSGWTACGATQGSNFATATFTPTGTLTASTTFACFVTPGGSPTCGTPTWDNGAIQITVEPQVSSYGTVGASGGLTQTVCDNVAPNNGNPFTVTGAAGSSGSFTYQWYYRAGLITAPSGSSTTGWTACTATQGSGFATSSFTAAGSSTNITYACFVTTASPVCGSGQWATNDVQVTVLSTGPYETSYGGANVCLNGSVSLTSNLSVVLPSTYQWYSSTSVGFGSPTTISGATSTAYTPVTSSSGTLYYEIIATFSGSGCTPATSNVQTVQVYTVPGANQSGGTSPICYNTDPGIFTANGTGGSGNFTYQWYNNSGSIGSATGSTYDPGNLTGNNAYHCTVTDEAGCGANGTTPFSVTVDGALTAGITGGTLTICYNTDPGIFTATGGGGTGSYTYQWYNGSGAVGSATSSTYNPGNLTASNSYFCAITSGGCGTANTPIVNITVHSALIATVTGGSSPICYNTAPSTMHVIASGGSGTYTYQWYNSSGSIGSATASSYAPGSLTASNSYYCSVTSGGGCGSVSSDTISITVDAALTAGISGGASPICYNTDPGVFTATGSGGTGSYTYQWYHTAGSVGGATSSTYDAGNITANDAYYCSVTSGSCGTTVTGTTPITVDAAVAITITGGTSPTCYNTSPGTFTATGSGGTGTYTYQWYNTEGSIGAATLSTYGPGSIVASDAYHCSVTSGSCGTAGSNTISITVVRNLISSSPTVSANPVCITSTGGGTNIQVANSASGDSYQLQTSLGANVGSAVTGTGGTINLPTGSITATTTYQVFASDPSSGCTATSPADILVTAVNPDIAFGAQLSGQHYTFGTIGNPATPSGWATAANTNGNAWGLATANPATSGSYSYYNGTGGTSNASTGAYIQTPTGAIATTPVVNLITGVIDATGFTNISVQWAAQKSSGYTGTISLYYSTDGGATWSSAVSFADVAANVTGTPWSLVNNTVQVKLPAAADNASNLQLKWSANPSTDGSYYSMNDVGIYGLGKVIDCGAASISLPYLNTSCSVNEYSLTADGTNPWPSSPAFSYVTGTGISGTPINIAVPTGTASGNYSLDIKVDDGAGHTSSTVSFPVNVDLLINATVGLDNCSCNYTTNGGIGGAYGNIVTVYASGGTGSGLYFTSGGVVDTLLSTIDASGTSYAGTSNHSGVKGVFWSKADGASHSYSISDGYCTVTGTHVTHTGTPTAIPFGNATGQPTAITAGSGGGNGISGSFNNSGTGDPNISNVNGRALTCHQTADFGNNWVTYQVNNMDGSGNPLTNDSTNNKAVVEINNNGNDLDSVEVSVYRDANLPVIPGGTTHNTTACYQYPGYGMERHFMIKSTKSTGANVFTGTPVGVRLYFTDAEFQDLAYWTLHVATTATGESASCAYLDTVTNLNSIYVTKYTGTNEDGDYNNNSASGIYRLFGKNLINAGDGPLTVDGGNSALTTGGATNLHYVQMNVTEFSEFWLGGSSDGEALPVQMIYLEAEAMSNDSIQVRWGTATEINNREFDVERSTDGDTWSAIGVVEGHNNSVVEEDYTYNDLNVVPGTNYYYRLKQVDNNGNYQYTGIVQAKINAEGAFAVMNFVPNPTTGNTQLTVVATKDQEITVDFYDMLGQKVLGSTQQITAGTNRMDFDLQRFAAGTYSVVVTSENQLYTKKIVIAR